jgi:hypothetical protein
MFSQEKRANEPARARTYRKYFFLPRRRGIRKRRFRYTHAATGTRNTDVYIRSIGRILPGEENIRRSRYHEAHQNPRC